MLRFGKGSLSLVCVDCGYESPGIRVGPATETPERTKAKVIQFYRQDEKARAS